MATKTISIDMEAYKRLSRQKKASESFSDVIKRLIKPPVDIEAWLKRMDENPLSDKFVEAVEEQVAGRLRRSRGGR